MNRILVIDSADVFIQYVELVVYRYGYDTVGVGSAREALEILTREPIDLVIAQENLPDMQWSDFCRELRITYNRTDIPIVVLSSDAASFNDPECQGLTAAGVRTKPVSMKDLFTVIQDHLPYHNRRYGIRAPLTMKAHIRDRGKFAPCQVLNLSEGGVFVMRNTPFPIGQDVDLLLPFRDPGSPVEISGKVVYVVETARGKHPRGMGIQFNELETGIQKRLHQYLEDHVSSILGR